MSTIEKLSKQSITTLASLLDDMFASCDDLFFDLASSAANNQEQNTFFESMREVRVRSTATKQNYERLIQQGFFPPGEDSDLDALEEHSGSGHSLEVIDDHETERTVTLTSMISRARAISKASLHEIESRLAHLQSLDRSNVLADNPVDPERIIKSFELASDDMELDINARVILYKQFERIVVKRLPEFYANFNKKLEEAGAKFDRYKPSKSSKTGDQQSAADSAIAGLDDNERLVSPLSNLTAQFSFPELANLLRTPQALNAARFPLFKSAGAGQPLESEQLLQLLNQAQQPLEDSLGQFDLRNFVGSLLEDKEKHAEPPAVNQVDEDIINLVAMFFDFALEDKDIPDNVRALLSRLQMPTLKVAIKDSEFFSNAEHPCRSFINRVAQISIGLNPGDKDEKQLLSSIEAWIQEIQLETDDIEAAFRNAQSNLETFAGKLEKRSKLVEKRTAETAEGEAMKQLARLKAQRAIEEMLEGKKIDTNIAAFISEHWQQVLYSSYMRNGDESSEWTSCLQVAQDLAWCAQPQENEKKTLQRFERIMRDLEQRIFEGLQITSKPADQIRLLASSAITSVNQHHQPDVEEELTPEPPVFVAAENQALDLIENKNQPTAETEISETDQIETDAEESITEKKQTPANKSSALELQQQRYHEAIEESLRKAEALPKGSWIEFKVPEQNKSIRCKLSNKILSNDSYVFVNRFGFKVFEKSKSAFAEDLYRNRARVLQSGPLFDRSLGSMVSSLRKNS